MKITIKPSFIKIVLILLFLGYTLEPALNRTPFDYDAVKNTLIIQALINGDFSNIFSHLSPLLFLSYGLGNIVFDSIKTPLVLNSLFLALHLYQFSSFIEKKYYLNQREGILFLLFYSSSFFLFYQSQCVSIEPLSLFLWGLILKCYTLNRDNRQVSLPFFIYSAALLQFKFFSVLSKSMCFH